MLGQGLQAQTLPYPALGAIAAAQVQEDPEPSLGTLGASRAGVRCPMAGGDVPGQGAMPQGTDAACGNDPAP